MSDVVGRVGRSYALGYAMINGTPVMSVTNQRASSDSDPYETRTPVVTLIVRGEAYGDAEKLSRMLMDMDRFDFCTRLGQAVIRLANARIIGFQQLSHSRIELAVIGMHPVPKVTGDVDS